MEIGLITTGLVSENGGCPGKCNRTNWRAVRGAFSTRRKCARNGRAVLLCRSVPGDCEIFATLSAFLEPQGTNLAGVIQGHFGAFHYLWLGEILF